jgi:hypothetical protein
MEEWPLPSGASVSNKLPVMQGVTGVTLSVLTSSGCTVHAESRMQGVQDAVGQPCKNQAGTTTGGAFKGNQAGVISLSIRTFLESWRGSLLQTGLYP